MPKGEHCTWADWQSACHDGLSCFNWQFAQCLSVQGNVKWHYRSLAMGCLGTSVSGGVLHSSISLQHAVLTSCIQVRSCCSTPHICIKLVKALRQNTTAMAYRLIRCCIQEIAGSNMRLVICLQWSHIMLWWTQTVCLARRCSYHMGYIAIYVMVGSYVQADLEARLVL